MSMVDDPETIKPEDDEDTKPPTRLFLKRSSSPTQVRPAKVTRSRSAVKQEHEVIYISSDSEPDDDIGIPAPAQNAVQRVPNLFPRADAQISGQSSPGSDEKTFRQALLLEDCLLLSSLDLDTDMADDVVPPRHSFNGKLRTAVQDLRNARIAEWQAVRDSSKANSQTRPMAASRIKKARKQVDHQRERLASMVERRVDGMIKDSRQPGLHADDWNRLQQHFPRAGQLRTWRPAIPGPPVYSAEVMGVERLVPAPLSGSTTIGVILPHALFPSGRHLPAEAWQTARVSSRLQPIEPGRVRLLFSMTPLPTPLAANRASRVEELKEEEEVKSEEEFKDEDIEEGEIKHDI